MSLIKIPLAFILDGQLRINLAELLKRKHSNYFDKQVADKFDWFI